MGYLAAALRVSMLLHGGLDECHHLFRGKHIEQSITCKKQELIIITNGHTFHIRICNDERLVPIGIVVMCWQAAFLFDDALKAKDSKAIRCQHY